MIYELYLVGKEHGLVLTKEAARLIYAGIVGDTGRFLFPSTNPKTFKYASELVEYGFSFVDLYDQLYRTKLSIAHLSGYVLQNFELSEHGVAHIILTKQLLKQYDATPSEASQLVSVLGNIDGIRAWVFLWKKMIKFAFVFVQEVRSSTKLQKISRRWPSTSSRSVHLFVGRSGTRVGRLKRSM